MQGSAAPPRATEGDGRPVSPLPPGEGLLLGLPREGFPLGVASLDGDLPQSACGQAARGRTVDHLEERDTLEELLSPSPSGTRWSTLQQGARFPQGPCFPRYGRRDSP